MSLKNFYKNKRVLVTGHTGFKGSWLTLILVEHGAKVAGFSLKKDKQVSNINLFNLKKKIIDFRGDLKDEKKIQQIIKKFKPQIVFHLAAQSLVKQSYSRPKETYETNVMGGINLIEAVRKNKSVKSLVFITSDKCYKNIEVKKGYIETDILGGKDPYSSSKAAIEIIFSSYQNSFFKFNNKLRCATARAGNVIGGADWSLDRIVPDIYRSIISNKNLIIRNPKSTRPWQHVFEPIMGYMILAKKLFQNNNKYEGAWNFGPNWKKNSNVLDIVNSFYKVFKIKKNYKIKPFKKKYFESKLLHLNSNKAKKQFNWKTKLSFNDTIKKTAEWYLNYYNNKNRIIDFSRHQINDYFKKFNK